MARHRSRRAQGKRRREAARTVHQPLTAPPVFEEIHADVARGGDVGVKAGRDERYRGSRKGEITREDNA